MSQTQDGVPVLAAMATGLNVPVIGQSVVMSSEVKDDLAYYSMMQSFDSRSQGIALLDLLSEVAC